MSLKCFCIFFPTEHGSLTIVRRSNSKKENLVQQQQLAESPSESTFNFDTDTTTIENFNFTNNFETMQATSVQTVSKTTGVGIDNIDLATDNLPAVDTPDACDKAATR